MLHSQLDLHITEMPQFSIQIKVRSNISSTGCNFTFLPCELIYYWKTFERAIIKLIYKMRRDVSAIVLKGQVCVHYFECNFFAIKYQVPDLEPVSQHIKLPGSRVISCLNLFL